jgi:hypothetical protein
MFVIEETLADIDFFTLYRERAQSPTTPSDDKGSLDAMAVTGTGSTTTPKPAATITKKSRPEFKSESRAAIEVKLEPQTVRVHSLFLFHDAFLTVCNKMAYRDLIRPWS